MHIAHPEVVIIYQEYDAIELAVEQIKSLNLTFASYKFNQKKLHEIAQIKPKILLLSSNSVKTTIQLYINYLEEYGLNIALHRAILLINNRESATAYLACESGLFDNYVIINPFNEPYRLKLVLLKKLKLLESKHNENSEKLIAEVDDEFASCIEHGVTLKNAFMHEVNQCESNLLSAVNEVIDDEKVKAVLENIITANLEEMNGNISNTAQKLIDQLISLKQSNQSIQHSIAKDQTSKKITATGVKTKSLINNNEIEASSRVSYKVLIAEPSDLFSRVIDAMFAETVFKYLLVHDGEAALEQINTFNPDVILMAYDLPKLNGIEVTKRLRKEGNKTPIVAYTHISDEKMIKPWRLLGLNGYIIKPSKKSIILNSIIKALKEPIEIPEYPQESNTKHFQWKPEYSVGHKEMDEQHQALFSMMNEFYLQKSKETAIPVFKDLSSCFNSYFDAEENLLRQINYPETPEHIKIYDELRNKFPLFEQKLENYNRDLHKKMSTFFYNWLVSHILKAGMDYNTYALSIEEPSFSQLKK
jgi:hemerythrin-like metal-binding protein